MKKYSFVLNAALVMLQGVTFGICLTPVDALSIGMEIKVF